MKKIINGRTEDGQVIWRYETAEEVLIKELRKNEGYYCPKCGDRVLGDVNALCQNCV